MQRRRPQPAATESIRACRCGGGMSWTMRSTSAAARSRGNRAQTAYCARARTARRVGGTAPSLGDSARTAVPRRAAMGFGEPGGPAGAECRVRLSSVTSAWSCASGSRILRSMPKNTGNRFVSASGTADEFLRHGKLLGVRRSQHPDLPHQGARPAFSTYRTRYSAPGMPATGTRERRRGIGGLLAILIAKPNWRSQLLLATCRSTHKYKRISV
jgi:hypothetical protein